VSALAVATVIVLYFENRTNDRQLDVLSKGIADMLVTDLSSVEGLQVVEREKLDVLIKEIDLQKTKFFDPATAQKLGKGIGATHAVAGSIAALEPEVRIDVRLIEIATGKVVMGDHVTGHKDRFFALEEELVKKFVAGLQKKGGSAKAGVSSVDMLLQYSKSVDEADKGDLKKASSEMAKVVSSSPEFALAKKRYGEILKRLHGAVEKRQDALANTEEQLLKNAEAFLEGKDITKLTGRDDSYYFGYRVLRGQYILHVLRQKHVRPGTDVAFQLSLKDPRAALPLLEAFYENTATLIDEIARWKNSPRGARMQFVPTDLHREDAKRAKELKIDDAGACYSCPNGLPLQLALWTVGVHEIRTMPIPQPSLARLDPTYGQRALELLDPLEKAKTHEKMTIAVLDTRAQVMLALERREEAMALWQTILDRFPTDGAFERIEESLKATLGVSKTQAALDEALAKTCDMELANKFGLATYEMIQYGGPERIEEKLGALEKLCAGVTPLGPSVVLMSYQFAMSNAASSGDCAFFDRLIPGAKRAKMPPGDLEALGQRCAR
jgi:TolB-like protein